MQLCKDWTVRKTRKQMESQMKKRRHFCLRFCPSSEVIVETQLVTSSEYIKLIADELLAATEAF